MSLDLFHPLIRQWFVGRFGQPTEPQVRGWPQIAAGKVRAHTTAPLPEAVSQGVTAFSA